VRILLLFLLISMMGTAFAQVVVEAAGSCVVIHKKSDAQGESTATCFENISLERTSFESGVCQWRTDAQALANVQITTRFVPHCPASYTGFCD